MHAAMSQEKRIHLQELPSSSGHVARFTRIVDPANALRVQLKENLENECTPQELIQSWSPPRKCPKICKGKENDSAPFVLARRPRKKPEAERGLSWDNLPDELLLGIFYHLPLADLLRVSRVCRRWHCLAFDEFLWHGIDLTGKSLLAHPLHQALNAGVVALRCPRTFIGKPLLRDSCPFRLQHADFSNCTVSTTVVEDIIGHCHRLQNLSLEGLILSDQVMLSLAKNTELARLNLSGCSGFSAESLKEMLQHCSCLKELNLAWCSFKAEHIAAAVNNFPEGLTQLNLSGYRESLCGNDVEVLVKRCLNLTSLDLSDNVLLTADCFKYFLQLNSLQHLGLSRCYQINPASLIDFEKCHSLKTLEVFGIVQDVHLPVLWNSLPRIKINTCPFTTIARPTTGGKNNRNIWGIKCRLSYRGPFSF
ncbi:S-phase kinase-associated protein 2 [Polypterus senegalus]|uniref:S-phase kinase-associated protein 2 n=1 Tax=Polypterus senegalus TaxID=55291 RepID=UPI001964B930|nr:S-phase kinase-associated protein 2 [Polypterus senegalus]